MMSDAIKKLPRQFLFKPKIENAEKIGESKRYIVLGMGGSHLAAGILKMLDPYLDIHIHNDYGLPSMTSKELREHFIIASSYSGNTEEVLDGFKEAIDRGLNVAAMSTGGKLIEDATKAGVPFVQIPNTGIQPRSALGFSLRALMKLFRLETLLADSMNLADSLNSEALEKEGKQLAEELYGFVPIIYTSRKNHALAYNWKIKFNETGKIPSFMNVFSELNHNEMTGFDVKKKSKKLSENFHFIFIEDENDHPHIKKRMKILKELYENRGLSVTLLQMIGASPMEKIFESLLLGDWTALYTAEHYGLKSEKVPMVEEFKKLIAD